MGFIDSYKRLEKLLSEVYGDIHGVSAYIDEMIKTSDGSYHVPGWKEDLKQLKHYRWIRNKIVHEPNCSEDDMCTSEDIQWINRFYSRIMAGDDPVTKYRRFKLRIKSNDIEIEDVYVSHKYENTSGESLGWITFLAGAAFGAVITFLILNIMKF